MLQTGRQLPRLVRRCQPYPFTRQNSSVRVQSSEEFLLDTNAPNEHGLEPQNPICSAYVRITPKVDSIVDAYAVIREIERKYGKLRQFKFFRDSEVSTLYRPTLFVIFESEDSCSHISHLRKHCIPFSGVDQYQPGGIGLKDLESWLVPNEVEKTEVPAFDKILDTALSSQDEEGQAKAPMLEFTIEPARKNFYGPSRLPLFGLGRSVRDKIARGMLNWGGFYQLKPIEKESLFSLPPEPSPVDHIRLRCAMRKWSELSGIPNPYERSPNAVVSIESTQATTDEHSGHSAQSPPEWDPLPLSTSDNVPVPNINGSANTSSINQTPSVLPQSTNASTRTLPTAPKNSPTISLRCLPTTSQAPSTTTEMLKSTAMHFSPTQDTASQQAGNKSSEVKESSKRKKRKKRVSTPKQEPESEPSRLTDRLKKLMGSWF